MMMVVVAVSSIVRVGISCSSGIAMIVVGVVILGSLVITGRHGIVTTTSIASFFVIVVIILVVVWVMVVMFLSITGHGGNVLPIHIL